ncbi:PhzF family phenazine biosynthesis protein [Hyphococcus sp.]|uniref:PhzF family phenazine biosynthesis protein n=1 Tax=Hyphococcus sp. TaxID=2038636 RepID=UPI003CCC3775
MRAYDFVTYDVFTNRRFAGNQLAVLLDAKGLSGEAMQAITREFNLAESSFVLPPENPENTARVRIFTPGYEMPFAGHPTVGTAIAIAKARGLEGELRLELNAGIFPVRAMLSGHGGAAEFQNPNLPRETGAAPAAAQLENALSLPPGSIDTGALKPRRVGAGVDFVYARTSLEHVRAAKVNSAAWELLGIDEVVGVYLYTEGGEAADASYHVRMFAPGAGIMEDPATGSAAAALPGHIWLSGKLADGPHDWVIEQGFEMGRPSRINVNIDVRNNAVSAVRIGGEAVAVQEGRILI